jgi:hypothetical protein
VLALLERTRERLAPQFPQLTGALTVVLHDSPHALVLSNPLMPALWTITARPARRYIAGWVGRHELHVLSPRALRERASGVSGSFEMLALAPATLYARAPSRRGRIIALVAYDEVLADRIRGLLIFEPDVVEKKMFGGLAFLIGGHMAVAVSGQGGLLMRCEPDETDELVARPYVEPFVMRGRAMDGWVRVDAAGVAEDDELKAWVESGVGFARSLPPK